MHDPPGWRQPPAWPAASRVSRARSSLCSSSLKALSSSASTRSRARVTTAWIRRAPSDGREAGPLLAGKPAVLVAVRGGAYGTGTPREGWDHSTGYLRRILANVWGGELTVVEREFTLVGVNPALDQFTELAAQMKDGAHAAALEAGRALTAAVVA